jgi:hypothetical protein
MNYEVVVTVKHRFSVDADTMEDSTLVAREFVRNLKPAPGAWGDDICWEDQEVVKVTAGMDVIE